MSARCRITSIILASTGFVFVGFYSVFGPGFLRVSSLLEGLDGCEPLSFDSSRIRFLSNEVFGEKR